jgi:hypothetical protein
MRIIPAIIAAVVLLAIYLIYRSAIDRAYSRISTGRQTAQLLSPEIQTDALPITTITSPKST